MNRLLWVIGIVSLAVSIAYADMQARVTPVVRVFQQTKGAVVNIHTTQVITVRSPFYGLDENLFDEIFLSPFSERKIEAQSLGSGIIVHKSGLIVTNFHVIARSKSIEVILEDGTKLAASIVGTDQEHDLAVLRVSASKPLPYIKLGDSSDLMVGETVIAIGNPLGYQHTVTTGVVSALHRELEFRGGVAYKDLIQTDASINPGNSGGPLLNIEGQLIGINSAIRGDAQGICFAIPVNQLKDMLPRLLDFERERGVMLGLTVKEVPTKDGAAVVVSDVRPNTPAAKAGLKAGEVFLQVNKVKMEHLVDFYAAFLDSKVGDEVETESADGQHVAIRKIKLDAMPKPDGAALALKRLGVQLRPLSRELAARWQVAADVGLLVVTVQHDSPLWAGGIKAGDLLYQMGPYHVRNLDEVGQILNVLGSGAALRVGWIRVESPVAGYITQRSFRADAKLK